MVNAALDERLSSYALIARAAIDVTIPLLTRLFAERFERLSQVSLPFYFRRISLLKPYIGAQVLFVM